MVSEGIGKGYEEWQEVLRALTAQPGVVLLVGASDTGKTTFARLLLNCWLQEQSPVAVLDADLGQSEIGPPACVGLAHASAPVQSLAELSPLALAFVGNKAPVGSLLELVTGVKRLAMRAGQAPLIVDTGGFIQGAAAQRLFTALLELLRPQHIVGLQRAGELEPILRLARGGRWLLHTPPVTKVIAKKAPVFRSQRRAMRFAAYFSEATLHTYTFRQMPLIGTWLGSGTPLPAHLLRFVRTTLASEMRVFYAEMVGHRLCLMADRILPPSSPGIALVKQQLRAQSVVMTPAPHLKHLLLGLEDAEGELLAMGLLEALDFRRGLLGVLSPLRATGAPQRIRLGRLRVSPEGKDLGACPPLV